MAARTCGMSAIGFKTDDFPPQISDTYGPQQMGYTLRACVCAHVCAEPAKTKTPMDQGTQNAANISHKGAESNPQAQSSGALMWNTMSYRMSSERCQNSFL